MTNMKPKVLTCIIVSQQLIACYSLIASCRINVQLNIENFRIASHLAACYTIQLKKDVVTKYKCTLVWCL